MNQTQIDKALFFESAAVDFIKRHRVHLEGLLKSGVEPKEASSLACRLTVEEVQAKWKKPETALALAKCGPKMTEAEFLDTLRLAIEQKREDAGKRREKLAKESAGHEGRMKLADEILARTNPRRDAEHLSRHSPEYVAELRRALGYPEKKDEEGEPQGGRASLVDDLLKRYGGGAPKK